ncbi:MAG: HAD family hydrolase [Opitutales bacterium]
MPGPAAIFDWDGVVVDSSAAHEQAWQRLAAAEGLPLAPGSFLRGFGKRNEVIIPEIHGWATDPAEIRRLSLAKEAFYRELAGGGLITLLPGVKELLGALARVGVPCVIGTSTHRPNLRLAFERFGLEHYFVGAVSSEDVTRGKPDPEVFLKACALAKGDIARSVVFEDTLAGIAAAKAGGFRAVALCTTNSSAIMEKSGADAVVADLSEVSVELALPGLA